MVVICACVLGALTTNGPFFFDRVILREISFVVFIKDIIRATPILFCLFLRHKDVGSLMFCNSRGTLVSLKNNGLKNLICNIACVTLDRCSSLIVTSIQHSICLVSSLLTQLDANHL